MKRPSASRMNRRAFVAGAAVLPGMTLANVRTAAAQAYPQRPVRMIVPYAVGGATDILSRLLAARMERDLGQPLVVDNRGGGASMIGTQAVATAAPDGYTIGIIDTAFMVNPSLFGPRVPYDTRRDFAPISFLARTPMVLLVHQSSPVKTVAELVALAKSKPGQLTYASAGLASGIHLASEQFRQVTGINAIHVPYRGGGPAIIDFVAGKIDFTFTTVPSILEHVRAGRVRPLAVTTGRVPQMPDAPSFTDVGLPAVDAALDFGIVVPANVPPEVNAKLSTAAAQAIGTDPLRQRLIDLGYQPIGSTPDVFRKHIESEIEKWSRVVAAGNIKPE